MEYLRSQQFWKDFGRNTDSPDGVSDNVVEVEDGGFGDADEDPTAYTWSFTKNKRQLSSVPPGPAISPPRIGMHPLHCSSITYRAVLFIQDF